MGALPYGRESDQSAWPRSADDAAAPSARKMPGTATVYEATVGIRNTLTGERIATSRHGAPRNDRGKSNSSTNRDLLK